MGIAIPPNTLTLLTCSVAENDATDGVVWSAGTTYSAGQKVRHNHKTYSSLASGNAGNNPETSSSGTEAKWMPVGATMPWRMLDDYVESQTVGAEGKPLTFSVPFNRATAFGLLNVEGATCTVRVEDDEEGVYYEETVDLVKDISGFSLFEYNYSLIQTVDTVVRVDLPMPITGTLHVSLDPGGEGSVAKVGHVVVGRGIDIGATLYGASVGRTDYSVKETNDFGQTTLIRRSSAGYVKCELYHHPNRADFIAKTLDDLRSRPVLWMLNNPLKTNHSSLVVYGWIEDWKTVFEGPNEQELSLEIQGMI